MKKRKLVHPRKVVWAMRDFVNEIHQLTYTVLDLPYIEEETTEEFWRRFNNAPRIQEKAKIEIVKKEGFCARTSDIGNSILHIGYNLNELYSKGNRQFAQNFISRCPSGKGFASVTLALLHELGHFHSQQEFEGYDREKMIIAIELVFPPQERNFAYFNLPDEMAATDWAIEWLSNAENRKIAKRFEKKFFECFE